MAKQETKGATRHGDKVAKLVEAVRALDAAYAAADNQDERDEIRALYEAVKMQLPDYARPWVGRGAAGR